MARVNFYLKDKHALEETPINLFFSYSGQRLKWYTGHSIRPKRWDFKKQRPKRLPELNSYLDTLTVKVKEIHADFLSQEVTPGTDEIKSLLNETYKAQPRQEETVLSLLADFVAVNPKNVSHGSLKQYKSLLTHLNGFIKATRYKLSFETIDGRFDEAFHRYLSTKETPLSPTSINKVYGLLKTFLRYMTKMGYNSTTIFSTFDRRRKKVKQIALNPEELDLLRSVEVSGVEELYRDAFLFACLTAMEFSALKNLKYTDIIDMVIPGVNEGQSIKCADYYRQKNKASSQTRPIAVLFEEAQAILDKYYDMDRASCFPRLNNQVFNRYIKNISQKAGINSQVKRIEYEGTEAKEVAYEKYQLISSHTARRTFATNAPYSDEVKRIFTGHATMKQLEEYKKESMEDRVRKVMGNIEQA